MLDHLVHFEPEVTSRDGLEKPRGKKKPHQRQLVGQRWQLKPSRRSNDLRHHRKGVYTPANEEATEKDSYAC